MLRAVHPIIYRLAFSPQAAKLEQKAAEIDAQITARFSSSSPDSEEDLATIDHALDEIFAQLKQLPTLPEAQVQEEYDRFPEAKLRTWGHNPGG